MRLVLVSALVLACNSTPDSAPSDGGSDAAGDAAPACAAAAALSFCDGASEFRWDPTGAELLSFPDDSFTVADATTPTGRRLDFTEARVPALSRVPMLLRPVFDDLSALDGFGTTAGAVLRFSSAFDAGSVEGDVRLVVLGDIPRDIPFETRTTDDGATLIVEPMVPLPPNKRVVVFATRDLHDAVGGCFAPGAALRRVLADAACGTGDAYAREVAEAVGALIEGGEIASASDLSALLVYSTQSIEHDSLAVAHDVAGRAFALDAPATCTDGPTYRTCETTFTAGDYRGPDGTFDPAGGATPVRTYAIPVTAYLPNASGDYGGPPYPTVIYGHGLGGDRHQGEALAHFAAPRGIATVAIDAVKHGQHPGGARSGRLLQVADFFGIDVGTFTFHARVLRDDFRQSTWDKLQLARMLAASGPVDFDGDGAPDLDGARLWYLGVSLGGIMGPELLALTQSFSGAVLVVPGGRVSTIIRDSSMFAPIITAYRPPGVTDGDVERFFPILQTAIDRCDPANYGAHLLAARYDAAGATPPSLLMGMVIDDEIVPNTSNRALARALGIPHVPPVLQPVGVIPTTGPAPIAGNLGGGVTAGLFQFDRIRDDAGAIVPATHNNIGASAVGAAMWMHFIDTWLRAGTAEIIDPYVEEGLK